jgi:hypothetical protein
VTGVSGADEARAGALSEDSEADAELVQALLFVPQRVMTERKPAESRRTWRSPLTFLTFGLVTFAGYAFAQTEQALPPPSALKKLSVEQLMDIEVTTVSRRESTVGQSPAAVFVI